MPSLIQRSRPESASARPSGRPASDVALPPYEPPTHPMNQGNREKLTRMAKTQSDVDRRKYEKHLAEAASNLRTSVGSINEMATARRQFLAEQLKKHDSQDGNDPNSTLQALQEYTAALDQEVGQLTDDSEEALRRILDCRAELEDTQKVLEAVVAEVAKQKPRPEPKPKKEKRESRRRTRNNDGDEDEDEDEAEDAEEEEMENAEPVPPLVGVADTLKATRKANVQEYKTLSAYERYATNNDYIVFKKHWHLGLHRDDGVPLPDATTWFDEDGRPVKTVGTNDNDDDDLVVEREIIDLKCPLSLQVYKEPFSNHKCKHTFEKSAITEFINNNRGLAKCPVCSQDLRLSDFYLDDVIMRKVKRAEQAAREDVAATSDAEEEDIDASIVMGRATNIKKEQSHPAAPRKRLTRNETSV
ncbi:E3 SUMO-protein ligase nse2 [Podospora australis]|uniref:E3 SUMO-protein ligase nse2 n=1 Tax=Podospora australis TaxID=1536484 RepID=A0AAN6WYU8_9PEZI|nr:E3 SUMO-protein ligase nse2 [Podospora australis]